MCIPMPKCGCESQGTTGLGSPLLSVGGHRTQVVRLYGKLLYLLTHFVSPRIHFFLFRLLRQDFSHVAQAGLELTHREIPVSTSRVCHHTHFLEFILKTELEHRKAKLLPWGMPHRLASRANTVCFWWSFSRIDREALYAELFNTHNHVLWARARKRQDQLYLQVRCREQVTYMLENHH